LLAIRRSIGTDIGRLRADAPATIARVADIAGLDRAFVGRIESGAANASLDSLVAIATALGADLSVRFYPGTGPRLTDRHQARMIETVLRGLAPVWTPHLEVPVHRPVRGVIDAVFERQIERLLVATEAYSAVSRLEQQIRWSAEKAASISSSPLGGPGPDWAVSRLLILRSTTTNRELARSFAATLGAAYPSRTSDAVAALQNGSRWPGDAIIWVRIDGDETELLDGPPRGVLVGR
jgi:transcriptional regulator with XRE-family HTH domain